MLSVDFIFITTFSLLHESLYVSSHVGKLPSPVSNSQYEGDVEYVLFPHFKHT